MDICYPTRPRERISEWQWSNTTEDDQSHDYSSMVAGLCPDYELINELINEWCMYIALYCVLLYTQSALQSCGGGGGLSSTTTSVQHPLERCDGCHRTTAPVHSPHTSYRWRGERVIEPIKWMGIIRRPLLARASGRNLSRTPGLHPYSLREVPWDV